MPRDPNTYLHRVGRAGRYETEGTAITFVTNDEEKRVLDENQENFKVKIEEFKAEEDN